MDNKVLIYAGLILLIFYLVALVPYCRITGEPIYEDNAIYTRSEILEITNLTMTLLNVKGTSMLPTIQDNSQCLCIKKETYNVGNIVLFFVKMNEEWTGVSHRIFSIEGEQIFTKGDNNDWIDPPMTEENIICMIPNVPRWKILF